MLIDGDWTTARQNYMHCYWKRYCRLHFEHHAVAVPRTCMFLVALESLFHIGLLLVSGGLQVDYL